MSQTRAFPYGVAFARAGADRLKVDAMHLTPEGYRLVAEEVVRILGELGVLPVVEDQPCVPA